MLRVNSGNEKRSSLSAFTIKLGSSSASRSASFQALRMQRMQIGNAHPSPLMQIKLYSFREDFHNRNHKTKSQRLLPLNGGSGIKYFQVKM